MARIGIFAFGSLIRNAAAEIDGLEVKAERRRNVLTPFRVEFARSSTKRGGAPTLVPHDKGRQVTAQILVLETTEQLAKDALWRRETDNLDSKRGYREPADPGINTLVIKRYRNIENLPLVLAATFAANIKDEELTAPHLARLAIQSAQNKEVPAGRDGITYLIEAKDDGIVTELSADYEREILRQSDTRTLVDARAKYR